ncbi:MAG: ABC transporter permease [Chthonomonadetes bacterium]|nr:ABC transporter permease [Chthonomonadetes bacterium]
MIDRFSLSVAIRHLLYYKGQTVLTMGVVAVSVTLIIFLGALIGGLQKRLISSVTGAIPHVVIRQPERQPVAVWDVASVPAGQVYLGERIKLQQQKLKIEDWQTWLQRLPSYSDNIRAVSPVVEGQAFLTRNEKRKAVSVVGMFPELHNGVVDIQSKLVRGRFFGLNGGEAVIGFKLADEFALRLGDKIRVLGPEGNAATYTVAGIFDTGFNLVDSSTIYITLRDAQSLFGVGSAVTSIGLKLRRIFEAEDLAQKIAQQVPYETNSWMKDNQQLLSGLRAQSQSSNLILVFTTIAAGFGIASIMITSVVTRLREIGILKAIGATNRQILQIFTLEGTLLAFLGAVAGAVQGIALSLALYRIRTTVSATGRTAEVFPFDLTPELVIRAVVIAVIVGLIASWYPAWRASRVNAIEVIRGV